MAENAAPPPTLAGILPPVLRVMIVTAFFYALFALVQYHYCLHGKLGEYLQPGGLYAAPQNLKDHGYRPRRFIQPQDSGWDGQFYYYLADDPFLQRDTIAHIDGPQYRAQRIGFALFAKALATVTGRSWVSPGFYLGLTVGLLLAATGMGAQALQRAGRSPYLILLWSLGGTPLFAILYGFVDAMADGFAIVALLCLLERRFIAYTIAMSFAVLTRESYALVPAAIGVAVLLGQGLFFIRERRWARFATIFTQSWFHAVPIALEIGWQLHLRHIFHGGLTINDLLWYPFAATVDFMTGGLLRAYFPMFEAERIPLYSLEQNIGLGFFLAMILLALIAVLRGLWTYMPKLPLRLAEGDPVRIGILLGLLAEICLYACFGPGMVWAPIGYIKGSGLFAIVLCFACLCSPYKPSRLVVAVFAGAVLFYAYHQWLHVYTP